MITKTPKVSVGLAVYNGAKYLSEAIDSVLAQSYQDFELVISDNASTDATETICREKAAQDGRVRYVRADQNHGAAWNFNRAFELARGEYVKWMAHDDVIGPDYLAKAVAVMEHDPELVLCHSRTAIIDSQGNLLLEDQDDDSEAACAVQGTTPEVERARVANVASPLPHRRYLGVLLNSIRCYEVFGVVRASQMRKTGLLRPFFSGEKVFLAELALMGPFCEVDEILSFSRWHPERFSANTSAKAQKAHIDPLSSNRMKLPRQFRSTWGYFLSILQSSISLKERVYCLAVLARFVLRVQKWGNIVRGYLGGRGQTVEMPESTAAMLAAPRHHWTTLIPSHPASSEPAHQRIKCKEKPLDEIEPADLAGAGLAQRLN